jgi:hypothetical protein
VDIHQTMRLPGFAAETSLGWCGPHHQGRAARTSTSRFGAICPALFRINGRDCDWAADGTLVCGDTPSGGGVGFGQPGLGPCATCKRNCMHQAPSKRWSCLNRCQEVC